MIGEYDRVRIIKTDISGIVVDIFEKNGRTLYTVESDEKGVPGGFGADDDWKLFTCTREELEELPQ